ncbi:MAG: hypothetical protein K6F77_05945 [Lachnospiraceae bacterium]|nr:hypothetical protein [Lachnospiraceae bacterium]
MNKITKRSFALFMVLVMTLLLPANRLTGKVAFAAENNTAYIKELKLFVKTHGDIKDAQSWCDSQSANKDDDKSNDWCVIPGNLNEGASGALKKEVAVFMCYQKTSDVKEAVRDIAVMNEGGNYSVGEYEYFLNEQKDMYADLVSDMQDMLKEYRTNYSNSVPTAVKAHDFLNTYVEDDSGKKLGDLLLDISDADLATMLLQANGQVVIVIQEQLTNACDTNETTWLDRMSKIGSYEKLKKKFMVSYNLDSKKAVAAMDQKYKNNANLIVNNWDDIYKHFESIKDYMEKNEINEMSDDELSDWIAKKSEENTEDPELNSFIVESALMNSMAAYKYGDASIMNFFSQEVSVFNGDNIRLLYPIVASLTEGQISSLNQTVSFYTIMMSAISSTAINCTGVGMSAKYDELDKEETKEFKEDKEEISDLEENYKEIFQETDPISVYEGVDRDVFNGGVAVTSTAKDYGNSSGTNWTDSFVESGAFLGTAIGLAAGSILSTVGAIIASKYATKIGKTFIDDAFTAYRVKSNFGSGEKLQVLMKTEGFTEYEGKLFNICKYDFDKCENVLKEGVNLWNKTGGAKGINPEELPKLIKAQKSLRSKLMDKGSKVLNSEATHAYSIIRGLKIGLTIFAILMAAADITMSIITLYKYYNRDHVDIPKYMVDLTYDENEERSYCYYKGLLDTDGGQGDLNGGGGKQWLAIYSTKDADAGNPILAPDGITSDFIVQYKNGKTPEGYSPLHMFGEPNVAQNLTFSDGDAGWSYNDKKGGIYLFFKRDAYDGLSSAKEGNSSIATVMSQSSVVFLMLGCTVAGILIGVVFTNIYRKRREKKVEKV